jgi:hypothetical protein
MCASVKHGYDAPRPQVKVQFIMCLDKPSLGDTCFVL